MSSSNKHDDGAGTSLPFVCLIFFFSGFPALLYQLIWQRSLFAIYGINVESVTVVVAAFMLGLGLGSVAGGALSKRPGLPLLLVFGAFELGIGAFGFASLSLFDMVGSHTLALAGWLTALVTFALVLVPTCLMGATLPILVAFLVRRSKNVGRSVGLLYFVNTLGSATACFVGAIWLFGHLGQSGSLMLAAGINGAVGVAALVAGLWRTHRGSENGPRDNNGTPLHPTTSTVTVRFDVAALLAFVCGFISLSYEILWFRVVAFTTGGLAAAFALLLGTYLAGIALGSMVARRLCAAPASGTKKRGLHTLGVLILAASVAGFAVAPVVAFSVTVVHVNMTLVFVMVAATLLGAAFPLISHHGVRPDARAGAAVSQLYLANIVGATAGSLLTGFVLLDHITLSGINLGLGLVGVAVGAVLLVAAARRRRAVVIGAGFAVAALMIAIAGPAHDRIYERLQFRGSFAADTRFSHVVENKSGVITVGSDGKIYGGGVYDGRFSTALALDTNGIVRAYSLSAWHPAPKKVLMIGLSSGSWAQVLAHHPQVETLTIVEINSGYLPLVEAFPAVASVLDNPKVHIVIDDGRRWLNRHPDRAFDIIVMNTSFHWRSNITNLLSVEFLELARRHLLPGGAMFYNTTSSLDVMRTGATVYPHALRFCNFMVVSDSPLVLERSRWRDVLLGYRIDGENVLDMTHDADREALSKVLGLVDSIHDKELDWYQVESRTSILARTTKARLVTDDNMGPEWNYLEAP